MPHPSHGTADQGAESAAGLVGTWSSRSSTCPTPSTPPASTPWSSPNCSAGSPGPAEHLADAREDVLAFTAYPGEHWRQIRSNNPRSDSTEKSDAEPTCSASSRTGTRVIRVVGAVLAEQHNEWAEGRRYLLVESLATAQHRDVDGDPADLPAPTALPDAVAAGA